MKKMAVVAPLLAGAALLGGCDYAGKSSQPNSAYDPANTTSILVNWADSRVLCAFFNDATIRSGINGTANVLQYCQKLEEDQDSFDRIREVVKESTGKALDEAAIGFGKKGKNPHAWWRYTEHVTALQQSAQESDRALFRQHGDKSEGRMREFFNTALLTVTIERSITKPALAHIDITPSQSGAFCNFSEVLLRRFDEGTLSAAVIGYCAAWHGMQNEAMQNTLRIETDFQRSSTEIEQKTKRCSRRKGHKRICRTDWAAYAKEMRKAGTRFVEANQEETLRVKNLREAAFTAKFGAPTLTLRLNGN